METKIKYYSIKDNLLPKNADINIAFGQRSQGKTYSTLEYCLERFKEKGYTFTYIRRWDTDVKTKDMEKLCADLPVEKYFGSDTYIRYYRGAFTLCKDEEQNNGKIRRINLATLGWAIALNAVHHTKSQSYPDCRTVVFDEFISMRNERLIPKEVEAYLKTLSTVLRLRVDDAKVFLLGNTVSQRSPYFMLYGIDIRNMKQSEITIVEIPYGDSVTRIAAEWCEFNEEIGQKTSKFVIGNKMAKTGQWDIKDVADIPHTANEEANEKMLFSMEDPDMKLNLGVFLRTAKWHTLEAVNGIYNPKAHYRQFLVIRQTDKQSNYFHLSKQKSLTYSWYFSWKIMMKDILFNTGIDVENELQHGRVYASGPFIADYFCSCYTSYLHTSISEVL